ncbi:MAG: hypothetical protein ACD_49C00029G0008 [uncultured bacterium (gcode 4)]|uniref:Uncharacterized protein n=1 Tax=uncultured bacterium (gcode 4) TaxID=1234023 RepID=K2AEY6_9BACT|nr:MAG: hypothetical protein ACD_49C00029G0008 [uncultured bacterium (gcode 4)]
MRNSNTARSTKKDGWKQASFTQLSGKYLRCNFCWEKVSRSQTEAHENAHAKPKKSSKNIERINSEIREVVEIILNTKKGMRSRDLLHYALNKRWVIDRIYKLIQTVWRLSESEKEKVNNKSLSEIKKELGTKN